MRDSFGSAALPPTRACDVGHLEWIAVMSLIANVFPTLPGVKTIEKAYRQAIAQFVRLSCRALHSFKRSDASSSSWRRWRSFVATQETVRRPELAHKFDHFHESGDSAI